MATNGSRNAAASSQALKVGAQMPTSGENASPTPAAVPLRPLSSRVGAHRADERRRRRAARSATSITHHARDASSSRHSFASSQREGADLRERKEDLFEIVAGRSRRARRRERRQLVERAFAAHAAAAQQHEAIADARRVADLMDRQEQRAAGRRRARAASRRRRGSGAGRGRRTARRPAAAGCGVSRPIASSARLRWPFDSAADRRVEQRLEIEPLRRPRRAGDGRSGRRRSRA